MQNELPLEWPEDERTFEGEEVDISRVLVPVVVIGPPHDFDPFIAGDIEFLAARLRERGYRACLYFAKWGLVSYHWFPLEVG